MMQAMNTGHDGSLTTLHANSPRDALSRLETMVLMAGVDLPQRAIREQAASALDLIVHQARLRDGTRRITHITEVTGMEGEIVTLQDLFAFDYSAGVGEDGRFRGGLRSTGVRPQFVARWPRKASSSRRRCSRRGCGARRRAGLSLGTVCAIVFVVILALSLAAFLLPGRRSTDDGDSRLDELHRYRLLGAYSGSRPDDGPGRARPGRSTSSPAGC